MRHLLVLAFLLLPLVVYGDTVLPPTPVPNSFATYESIDFDDYGTALQACTALQALINPVLMNTVTSRWIDVSGSITPIDGSGHDMQEGDVCFATAPTDDVSDGYPDFACTSANCDILDGTEDYARKIHFNFLDVRVDVDMSAGQTDDFVVQMHGNEINRGYAGASGGANGYHKSFLSTSGNITYIRTGAQDDSANRGTGAPPQFPFSEGSRQQVVMELFTGSIFANVGHEVTCELLNGDRDDICRAIVGHNLGSTYGRLISRNAQAGLWILGFDQSQHWGASMSGNRIGMGLGADPDTGGQRIAAANCTSGFCSGIPGVTVAGGYHGFHVEGNQNDFVGVGFDRATFTSPHFEHGTGTDQEGNGFALQAGYCPDPVAGSSEGQPCTDDPQCTGVDTCAAVASGVGQGQLMITGGRIGTLPAQWDAEEVYYGLSSGPSGTALEPGSTIKLMGMRINPTLAAGTKGVTPDCSDAGVECNPFVPNQTGTDQPFWDLTESDWKTNQLVMLPVYANHVYPSHPFMDIQYSGATGDGTTDDLLAIQNVINSIPSAGGRVVTAPAGTYRMKPSTFYGAIRFTTDNVALIGDGPLQTIFEVDGDNSPPGIAIVGACSGADCVTQKSGLRLQGFTAKDTEPTLTCTNYDNVCEVAQAAHVNPGDVGGCGYCKSCVDEFNAGGPPQVSGVGDGFCDSDGTTQVTNGEESHPIIVTNWTDVVIEDVIADSGGDESIGLSNVQRGKILNSRVVNAGSLPNVGGSGLSVNNNSGEIEVRGNLVEDMQADPTTCSGAFAPCVNTGGALHHEGTGGGNTNVTWVDNKTRNNDSSYGFRFNNNAATHANTSVIGNVIDHDVGTCDSSFSAFLDQCAFLISASSAATGLSVESNHVLGCSTFAAIGVAGLSVIGNRFSSTQACDAVILGSADDTVFQGNNVGPSASECMLLQTAKNQMVVSGNSFIDCGTTSGGGVLDNDSGAGTLAFTNNVIKTHANSTTHALSLKQADSFIANNQIIDSAGDGILLVNSARSKVIGNFIDNPASECIEVFGDTSDYVTVEGNTCNSPTHECIEFDNADFPRAHGNTCIDAFNGGAGAWIREVNTVVDSFCDDNLLDDTDDSVDPTITCDIVNDNMLCGTTACALNP